MNEVCILTQSMTPNQISAACEPTIGVSIFCVVAAIIGRMMNAISKKSRKNARKKIKRLIKIRNPQGPPGRDDSMFSSHLLPSTPKKNDGEAGRSDQDENHHGGYPHGGLVALLDQLAQLGNAVGFETKPSHREISYRESQLEQQGYGVERAEQHAHRAGGQTDHEDP